MKELNRVLEEVTLTRDVFVDELIKPVVRERLPSKKGEIMPNDRMFIKLCKKHMDEIIHFDRADKVGHTPNVIMGVAVEVDNDAKFSSLFITEDNVDLII